MDTIQKQHRRITTCLLIVYSIIAALGVYTWHLEMACRDLTATVKELKRAVDQLERAPKATVTVEDGETIVEIPK